MRVVENVNIWAFQDCRMNHPSLYKVLPLHHLQAQPSLGLPGDANACGCVLRQLPAALE